MELSCCWWETKLLQLLWKTVQQALLRTEHSNSLQTPNRNVHLCAEMYKLTLGLKCFAVYANESFLLGPV